MGGSRIVPQPAESAPTVPAKRRLRERVIITGRACVRMIEAVDVLLDYRPARTERGLLRLVRTLYS